jgi:hypothetical protein
MIRLIQYLNEKNHFLEKFYTLNEEQIIRLEAGMFEELEVFYNQREDLLKIIKYVDAQIHKAHMFHKDVTGAFTENEKAEIRESMRAKEAYVKRILEQDLKVLGMIDDAKSNIIKELKGIQKTRKALTGYKASEAG